mmetsp:Transcript_13007/g.23597  ORF Transcript_13007/g.23597 Transcript_13007/m.23597 type:complete len:118 (-) Transcript_13007:303-656(-)
MEAISSILSRVNIPLSLEQKELVTRNLNLQEEIRELKTQVTKMCESRDAANTKLKKISESFICQICQSENVDIVLVPCGHLLCTACKGRLRTRACPFCRQRYQTTIKYFSPLENNAV